MAKRSDITPEMCRKWLRYDPATGKLFWLPRTAADFMASPQRSAEWMANNWNAQNANREAFTTRSKRGHLFGTINKCPVEAHRVIWAMLHGRFPDQVDHIDGDPSNNRQHNLRSVTTALNNRNKALPVPQSGHVGVRWFARLRKWQARIGARTHLGYFSTIEAAVAARQKAEQEEGYHPNHARRPRNS